MLICSFLLPCFPICLLFSLSYLRKSDLGDDDGVHGAGSVPERLGGVTVRVVLVLVDLLVLLSSVPRHSAPADADVALGVDRGGLAAEVPVQS